MTEVAEIESLIEQIDQRNATEAALIDDLKQAWSSYSGTTPPPPPPPPVSGSNLATPNFASGTWMNTSKEGWKSGVGAWTFNGDGTMTVGPAKGVRATGVIEPKTAIAGKRVALRFRMDSSDGASGTFFVKVTTEGGGGGTRVFQDGSVKLVPGSTANIELGVIPTKNNRLEVIVARQPGATGTVNLSQIAIVEV